jgi:hypothetical protein
VKWDDRTVSHRYLTVPMARTHTLKSHLSVLQTSASRFASSPAFYVPQTVSESGDVASWEPVTYSQFLLDVELFAKHWGHVLTLDGIPRRSVIGMWSVLLYLIPLDIQ